MKGQMFQGGLRGGVEAQFRAALAAAVRRGIDQIYPERDAAAEASLTTLIETIAADGASEMADVAYRALCVPLTTRRVRGTIEGDSLRTSKGSISVQVHCEDTDENILDLRRLRGNPVEILGTQLEFAGSVDASDLDAAANGQADLFSDREIADMEKAVDETLNEIAESAEASEGPVLYQIVDQNGVVIEGRTFEDANLQEARDLIEEFAAAGETDPEAWQIVPVTAETVEQDEDFPPEETAEPLAEAAPVPEPEADVSEPPEMVLGADGYTEPPTVEAGDFSDAQKAALNAFREGGGGQEAAQAADVSIATLKRWMKLPAFRKAVADAGEEYLKEKLVEKA